jgi:hypothetical protein
LGILQRQPECGNAQQDHQRLEENNVYCRAEEEVTRVPLRPGGNPRLELFQIGMNPFHD